MRPEPLPGTLAALHLCAACGHPPRKHVGVEGCTVEVGYYKVGGSLGTTQFECPCSSYRRRAGE